MKAAGDMPLFILLASIFMVHKSSAVNNLCLYCDHVALPQDCTHVVRCPNQQNCYLEKFQTIEGRIYYKLGCKDVTQCSDVAIGRRKTLEINKRTNVEHGNLALYNKRDLGDTSLCHACCSGQNVCNVEGLCGAPTLNKYGGTICFACSQEEQPDSCRQIRLCASGQGCVTREIVNQLSRRTLYQTGCGSRDQCLAEDDGTQCCTSDLCNNMIPCNEKLNASLGVPYVGSDRKVKFNCSILTSTLRTDVQYSVTWTIDGFPLKSKNGIALVNVLSSYERVAIFDTINLQGNLNKMLRCKVEVTCSNNSKVEHVNSNGYWVGMKVSPQRIRQTINQNVTIESTLPLISLDPLDKLSVGIQIESTGRNVTKCAYSFELDSSTGKYTTKIPVHILPHSFYKLSDTLIFRRLKNLNYPMFYDYSLPIVHIGPYITAHDAFSSCKLEGNSVRVFDNSILGIPLGEYLYLILYRTNDVPTMEVEVKRQMNGMEMVTCGVFVKEGNDAVQIDVCEKTTSQFVPKVKYLSKSAERTIVVQQSDNGLRFVITVLTGSNITVDINRSYVDMNVTLSIINRDLNPPGGICGNETWSDIPGIGYVSSKGQKKSAFLQTWTLTKGNSSFDAAIPSGSQNIISDIGYCKCASNLVSCGTTI
ncbi:uncharacterized protein [Mytilus edulis]|uniref:uncharacterized protein isoform X1 n=1 Tax=Mytilus edulis TaxID=6550 RepID=UPI0039EF104A